MLLCCVRVWEGGVVRYACVRVCQSVVLIELCGVWSLLWGESVGGMLRWRFGVCVAVGE